MPDYYKQKYRGPGPFKIYNTKKWSQKGEKSDIRKYQKQNEEVLELHKINPEGEIKATTMILQEKQSWYNEWMTFSFTSHFILVHCEVHIKQERANKKQLAYLFTQKHFLSNY